MSHVSLYRKYRPNSFAEVVGQDHVTETLTRAIETESWHHAYLFCGPRGTGKTSSARLLAMCLNATDGPQIAPPLDDPIVDAIRRGISPDVVEIDAASNSGVDDVRDLRDKIAYSPTQGRLRIYIVDECHMLSNSAWNAFLKTIEEPPGHVVFIFATTEPHKVLPTVLSRTQRFDFRRVNNQVLTEHCKKICEKEGVNITDEALAPIVRAGDGSVRDTLSVLDQVIAFSGKDIDLERVNKVLGSVPTELLDQLVEAISNRDVAHAFEIVGQAANQGIDLRQFALDAQNYLRELMILSAAPDAGLIEGTPERVDRLKSLVQQSDTKSLLYAVSVLNDAQIRMRAGNTRLPLEIALAKAVLGEDKTQPEIKPNRQRQKITPVESAPVADTKVTSSVQNEEPKHESKEPARPEADVTPLDDDSVDSELEAKANSEELSSSQQQTVSTGNLDIREEKTVIKEVAEQKSVPVSIPNPNPTDINQTLSVEFVKGIFNQLLEEISKPILRATLAKSSILKTEGSVIYLGVEGSFHESNLKENTAKLLVENILSKLLRQRVLIDVINTIDNQGSEGSMSVLEQQKTGLDNPQTSIKRSEITSNENTSKNISSGEDNSSSPRDDFQSGDNQNSVAKTNEGLSSAKIPVAESEKRLSSEDIYADALDNIKEILGAEIIEQNIRG